ncbi:MAG: dienelactone hydrolase family protein, partial [Cyanobacteria bacterium P01_F01_bin.3]
CNFPAVSRRGWSLPVPTLMLLGSEDNVSRAEECLEIVERTNRRSSDRENAQTTAYVYEAGHVFDARYVRRRYDPEATADARERILDFLGAHGNKDVDGLEIAEVAN